ncbi:pilus assembly protein PapD [Burkholderia ubonensis]|uniref:Pilus assembly protein PapD n=1 Tax=Burkholderia ubonensis TaxID=101571 RepID=A0A102I5Y2_9BURK|nr:fimbria/pilus periplasmic chaperone [Burkholderia ubonensis]AOI71184.1 pilus assembly protein PapD [Burkholderia ubonensis]KUZ20509.1 pilus assembly protein PapD [Burkholderia ubonensis]KUZ26993.1 pilus assembly protein PapD [Burkholderia ubonensis]KUZ32420.1 pilus assembly protein PapD [Burkholderia ubonensis]KUZ48371.1 pilus assembly protein PapD [Burkholderia ubonensis]
MAIRARLLAALCAASAATESAATLQISPVTLELPPSVAAAGVTLTNSGAQVIYGQVRTFRWTQENGEDVLTPTDSLAASPPLLQIGANAEQLIRLVRTTPATPAAEESYRVLIDELPAPGTPVTNGITLRLRYSVPVFVEPDRTPAPPRLDWRVESDPRGWLLSVSNLGGRRAQISAVRLVDAQGNAQEVARGLLGYALAGSVRRWPLRLDARKPPFVKVRATVNAQPVEARLTPP